MRSGKYGMRLWARYGEARMTLVGAVAVLMALIFVMSAASLAIADVDTVGSLRQIPSTLKSPGEVQPLFEKANGDYECYSYSDVQNAADSYVIGNCDAPWQIQVVSYSGPNGDGYHSYGGFITGNFSGCGWIETRFEPKKLNGNKNSACGEGSTGDFEVPQSSFMERHNSAAGDGWPVVTTQACPEYANYRPWSSNNVEQELIRTAPAYASSSPGSNYPALKWRYITKYESTDGTHRYVMVRDDRYNAGEGNWVFVPRSCLPATLPENENERLPPPPTVTTDGASEIASSSAKLNATINPNGVDTQYFFEYGTTESYGSYTSLEDAGAGTSPVLVSTAIGGLASSTTYYFRIVASSATGEVFGGPVAFTTQPVPPSATTGSWSNLQPHQATLSGTVNPNGADTHYYFQYGPTTSYGSSTPEMDAGSGRTGEAESATITNLPSGTAVYYRIVASNAAGTSYGEPPMTFMTPNPSFTGTSQADLIMCNNNEYAVAPSNGKEFAGGSVWSKWGCSPHSVVGDFTGNGKDDIAVPNTSNNTWNVSLSTGTEFGGPGTGSWLTGWTAEPSWAAAGDFTGNGIDDLIMCNNNEYAVAPSNGKEFAGGSVWLHAPCKAGAIVGDFNGDGKDDLAIPNESNSSWTVELSDGTKFGAAGSGTWLSGWTAKPYWIDAGEGVNSQWTGEVGGWATTPTPDATGAPNNRLTSVSCASSTFCFATAYEVYNGTSYAYGESWNGSEWKIQSSGLEPNAGIQFAGVSCTSSTSCTAVGGLTESSGNVVTVAYNWNGSKWTHQTTPNATGAPNNRLTSVSCTSSTFCFATAYEVYNGTSYAYGESWNGSEWKIQSSGLEPNAGI
ncbi:MAG TPA: VCBS repeat-containing protein, partial [Solirubrobacteraceae bacterium]|nr:VCBS repeat-containing protein [Solirubrobacteraceae bacterium]